MQPPSALHSIVRNEPQDAHAAAHRLFLLLNPKLQPPNPQTPNPYPYASRAATRERADDATIATRLAALIAGQEGRELEAVTVLRKAVRRCNPRSAADGSLFFNLAVLLLRTGGPGEATEALAVLREGHRLYPGDLDVRAKLGWLLFALQEDEEGGEALLRAVLERDPSHVSGVVCLLRVLQEVGRDEEEEMLQLVARAVTAQPTDALLRSEKVRVSACAAAHV